MKVKDIKLFMEFLEKIEPALKEYGFQVKRISPMEITDRYGNFINDIGDFTFVITPRKAPETTGDSLGTVITLPPFIPAGISGPAA
jgi:hypothetical protein